MKKFDFYEFTGILTPGVILLYAVSLTVPAVTPFMGSAQLSVGDLGLFVVLAYVAGHLVQSLGNLIEWAFWKPFGGMPSNWVIGGRTPGYLNPQQLEALPAKVTEILKWNLGKALADMTEKEWKPVVGSIYAAVQAAGRSGRVDVFNGNYGMLRGVASGLLVAAVLCLVRQGGPQWWAAAGVAGLAVLALVRMFRFGRHNARELFIQFLQLRPESLAAPKKEKE